MTIKSQRSAVGYLHQGTVLFMMFFIKFGTGSQACSHQNHHDSNSAEDGDLLKMGHMSKVSFRNKMPKNRITKLLFHFVIFGGTFNPLLSVYYHLNMKKEKLIRFLTLH